MIHNLRVNKKIKTLLLLSVFSSAVYSSNTRLVYGQEDELSSPVIPAEKILKTLKKFGFLEKSPLKPLLENASNTGFPKPAVM